MTTVKAQMKRHQQGFTLLEILVVMVIFSVVAVMAYGGLSAVLKLRASVEAASDRTAAMQKAYMRLRNDIMNLAPRPIRDNFGDPQSPVLGTATDNALEFTRAGWANPMSAPRTTFERVLYTLRDGTLERSSYRVLDRGRDTEPLRLVLIDRVRELSWRYLDGQQQWQTQWPPSDFQNTASAPGAIQTYPLPLAVEVNLVTEDMGSLRFLFPVSVVNAPRNLGAGAGAGAGSGDGGRTGRSGDGGGGEGPPTP